MPCGGLRPIENALASAIPFPTPRFFMVRRRSAKRIIGGAGQAPLRFKAFQLFQRGLDQWRRKAPVSLLC